MTAPGCCPHCGGPLAPRGAIGRPPATCGAGQCLLEATRARRKARQAEPQVCEGCSEPGHQLRPSGRPTLRLCPLCWGLDADHRTALAASPRASEITGCGSVPGCRRSHWCRTCAHSTTAAPAPAERREFATASR